MRRGKQLHSKKYISKGEEKTSESRNVKVEQKSID